MILYLKKYKISRYRLKKVEYYIYLKKNNNNLNSYFKYYNSSDLAFIKNNWQLVKEIFYKYFYWDDKFIKKI